LSSCQKQTKRIRGILFDKDGTLIDFHTIWTPLAFELAAKIAANGLPQSSERNKTILLEKIGVAPDGSLAPDSIYASGTAEEIARALYGTASELQIPMPDQARFSDSLREDINSYMAANRQRIRPIEGVSRTLEALRQRGLVLGVSTSDSREGTLACLDEAGLREYFQYIGCADTVNSPKPSGDILMDFCGRFELAPREVAIAGDTAVDMAFARQNGAGLAIGVLSGTCREDELAREADILLDSVASIVMDGVPVWEREQPQGLPG
jgi:Predicted phosphatases